MEWFIWLWLGIIIVTLLLEFATADMVAIWFTFAAVPSFILALFGVNEVVQVITFVVITIVLLLLTRPFVMKYFKTNEIKSNVDAIVGLTGVTTKTITPDSIGRIKIRNVEWSAVSKQDIEIGEHVRVLDVEGVKVIVEKI